jgi:hypothetical protein
VTSCSTVPTVVALSYTPSIEPVGGGRLLCISAPRHWLEPLRFREFEDVRIEREFSSDTLTHAKIYV